MLHALELYARLLASPPASAERQHVFEELKAELAAHETAEERCFYVPLFQYDQSVEHVSRTYSV